jgi:uncharacterized delta-60 repeat protein
MNIPPNSLGCLWSRKSFAKMRTRRRMRGIRFRKPRVEGLEDRCLLTVHIVFDYSQDTDGFFAKYPQAMGVLQQAADYLTRDMTNSLTAIADSPGNTWTPILNEMDQMFDDNPRKIKPLGSDYVVPADTIVVFVGGAPAPAGSPELGKGGPASYSGNYTDPAFNNNLLTRGQPGAAASPPTAFSPWGGEIAFDDSGKTTWYFGDNNQVPAGDEDFFTVATHELGHVLGIGTAPSWFANVHNDMFTGQYAEGVYGGPVPLDTSEPQSRDGHWAQGDKFDPVMQPAVPNDGQGFTALDFAGLQDIGWTLPEAGEVLVIGYVYDANLNPVIGGTITVYGQPYQGDGQPYQGGTNNLNKWFSATTAGPGQYGNGEYDGFVPLTQLPYLSATLGNTRLYPFQQLIPPDQPAGCVEIDWSTRLTAPLDSGPLQPVDPDGIVTVDGTSGNDQITVSRLGLALDVSVNGTTTPYDYSHVSQLIIDSGSGTDTLTVDCTNGMAIPPDGINFDDGYASGNNELIVKGVQQCQNNSYGDYSGNMMVDGGAYVITYGGVSTFQGPMPVFDETHDSIYTLAGDALGLDVSASDTDSSNPLPYSLSAGSPGFIEYSSNQPYEKYNFSPAAGQTGTYSVTVDVAGNDGNSATMSFEVIVQPVNPVIGSFVCSTTAITTLDNTPITFTASNVSTPNGTVDVVDFSEQTSSGPQDLGRGTYDASSDSWSLTRPLIVSSPGTVTIVAVAYVGVIQSAPSQVTLQVGPSTVPASDLSASGSAVAIDSNAAGRSGWVGYDQTGDLSFVYEDSTTAQAYLQRFGPAGASLGPATALAGVQPGAGVTPSIYDVAFLPDGGFIMLWSNAADTSLFASEFNADGSPYGSTLQINATGPFAPDDPRIAISSPGQYAVVVLQGATGSQQVNYYRFGLSVDPSIYSGLVLGQGADPGSEDVAMDPLGASVVVWGSSNLAGGVNAQRVDSNANVVGGIIDVNALPLTEGFGFSTGGTMRIATDENGDFACVWSEDVSTGDTNNATDEIYARRFRADGTPLDAQEFPVADVQATEHFDPTVLAQDGKLVIAWDDYNFSDSSGYLIGQAYAWDNTLQPLGGNFLITNDGDAGEPGGLAIDPLNGNLTVGLDEFSDTVLGVFASSFQNFAGLNTPPSGFALLNNPTSPLSGSSLVSFGDNLPVGTAVGVFESPATGNWTYTLVPGLGNNDNNAFQIVDGSLVTNATFDVNTQADFSIRVQGTPDVGIGRVEVFDLQVTGTFQDGYVLTNFGMLAPQIDIADSAAIQPDGDLVVTAAAGPLGLENPAIIRYNPDGSLDSSFGSNGVALLPAGEYSSPAIVVQPDGRIVTITGYGLTRLNPDGSLDASFGTDGVVTTTGVGSAVMALSQDGMIVTAGEGPGDSTNSTRIAVARYEPDGQLDSSFGEAGIAEFSIGSSYNDARAVAIQPDGKIVVAGDYFTGNQSGPNNGYDALVVRFLANGQLDSSFNGVGYVNLGPGFGWGGVAVQNDGRILVAGTFGVARLNTDGTLDKTFNGSGLVATSLGTEGVSATALSIELDNKILVAGTADSSGGHFVLLRYSPTGALDSSWQSQIGWDQPFGHTDLVLEPDGRAVVVGTGGPGTVQDVALWEVNLNSPPTATISGFGAAVPGQPVMFTIGALDPSLLTKAGDFSYSVNWGDGTPTETFVGPDSVSVWHTYSSAGSETVQVTATDNNNLSSEIATASVTVVPVTFQPDSVNPGQSDLVVGDTSGNGLIQVVPGNSPGNVAVTINGIAWGQFAVTGPIDLFTEGSAGAISVSPQVTQPVFWNGAPVAVMPSLSQSTVSLAPTSILPGQTALVTLTAYDASGNREIIGGLNVSFDLGAGSAGGTFGPVADNDNGTYSATFTPSNSGTDTITATIGGQSVTSGMPTLTVIPIPTITGLSPVSAIEGTAQFTLTVSGTHFASGYSVLWNGTALATNFVSATTLNATVPATDLAQAGAVLIAIGYLGNTSPNPQTFTVLDVPEITGLSPASALAGSGAVTLTVNGANFEDHSVVLWNGAALATVFVDASKLTATVPAADLVQTGHRRHHRP